jgi:Glycine zipper
MRRPTVKLVLLLSAVTLVGCETEPPRQVVAPQVPPDTSIYFYPVQGHAAASPEQQDRDKYECNTWAVRKTGFDSSLPTVPPHERVQVVAGGPPPGTGVAVGAVTGAVVGAAVSSPWHTGTGALVGALAGAAIGGVSDAERSAQTDRLQAQANVQAGDAQAAALEREASDYRRAMSACLEGRGYSVK